MDPVRQGRTQTSSSECGGGEYFEKFTKFHVILLYDLNLLSHEFIFNLFDRISSINIRKVLFFFKGANFQNPNF